MTLLEKAGESLAAARLCCDAGHYNSATSRGYYASYQAVRSELERLGIEPLDTGITGGERWEHRTLPQGAMEFLGMPDELVQRLQADYWLRVRADYHTEAIIEVIARAVIEHAEAIIRWIEEVTIS
jgi:HEPN domain-containing protein